MSAAVEHLPENPATAIAILQSRADIREAAKLMGREEIGYLVNSFYEVQEFRKSADNMSRSMVKDGRPNQFVAWLGVSQHSVENDIEAALKAYVFSREEGVATWAMQQHGIAHILTAGLLSQIDIERCYTAGHLWSFAGLNPAAEWKKGKRRPWNAFLKSLCWKIGDSFVKHRGSDDCVYGHIYAARKHDEAQRNEAGEFADQARAALAKKNFRDTATRECYESGKLPLGRIDLRARRIAVKLFLAHYHDVATWYAKGHRAPTPYAIAHMGHVDMLEPVHAPWPAGTKPR